ncbi:DUF745 domain containing protein [Asbolus verrucosus]|uniref:DUF745 domain containing protein n=1 Tax=Asbolus verrucosus TaxID=1661398 RepID=A0A482W539_ASBVE|nr:DUF745 domain containing protein [Asbolus verrucosus]
MSKFFVAVFACMVAIASAKQQKLSVVASAEPETQSTHHNGIVAVKFGGDYSVHGGKKYSSSAELTSLAHTSAVQARTAVRNQQTAGIQAALGAQTGYARAALEAASAAQVALVAKQVIVQNLQRELEDAQHQLQAEQAQYQQTLQAANAAQNAVQQNQQQLSSATAVLAAVQQSGQQTERAAAAATAVAAAQHQMVQEVEQRLGRVHSRLNEALAGLQDTQASAEKAAAAAHLAQNNAAASAQLVAVNSVAANNEIDDHVSELHHH